MRVRVSPLCASFPKECLWGIEGTWKQTSMDCSQVSHHLVDARKSLCNYRALLSDKVDFNAKTFVTPRDNKGNFIRIEDWVHHENIIILNLYSIVY